MTKMNPSGASPRRDQPAKNLFITLEFKSAPEHRIVSGLADVLVNGATLASATDGHDEVKFPFCTTNELRVEFEVQGVRDPLGPCPRERGDCELARHHRGCFARPTVIRVTGNPAFIKDEQEIHAPPLDGPTDSRGQLGERFLAKMSVAIVEEFHLGDPKHLRRKDGDSSGSTLLAQPTRDRHRRRSGPAPRAGAAEIGYRPHLGPDPKVALSYP